ncbi:MAG: hypothetical protein U1E76_23495 [Planctomycetota bacterium]
MPNIKARQKLLERSRGGGRDADGKVFEAYGVSAMPYALLIGVDGKVVGNEFCNQAKLSCTSRQSKSSVAEEHKLLPDERARKTDARTGG